MGKAIVTLILTGLLWSAPVSRVRHRTHTVMAMKATAFAHATQPTAAGTIARKGIVAADPGVLPLGTRIRVLGPEAYARDYLVTATGAGIKGRHIDIYMPSLTAAKRFGSKIVRVMILEWGKGAQDARLKEEERGMRRERW